ncbi:Protein of unknown function (DUF3150) [Thiocystis violascens DSM 198]|uniref:DUF3150 domain-containing protein n=2 Tax=Thiocystis violascens TaxID=73141 RepID=I3Y6L8_THIV6|nr:Protein of unknown function (DUF3150) [Thiocystis violascens DSM 198]
MQAITTITDQVTLVILSIAIWSGRKKLRAEDLKLGAEMPPEDLVSLGSKRVCDPDALKGFHRIKQRADRACLRVGTRFLGGYAVPHAHAEALAEQLDMIKTEFDRETRTFLCGYDQALEQWINRLPEFEEPIRRAIEPAAVVGARLRFGYQLVQIAPADHPGTLAEEVAGLGDGIFAEVSQLARDLDGSFEGKDKLHRRALGTFGRIREKLACLSFLDERIQPVVDAIDDWVGRLPMAAPITGGLFNEGMGLALLLSDPHRLARHGAGQWSLQHDTEGWEPDAEQPSFAAVDGEQAAVNPGSRRASREIESFFF